MKAFDLSPSCSRAEACLYIANTKGPMQVIVYRNSKMNWNLLLNAYWHRVRILANTIGISAAECEVRYVRPNLVGYTETSDGSIGKLCSLKENGSQGLIYAINSFYIFDEFFPGIKFE